MCWFSSETVPVSDYWQRLPAGKISAPPKGLCDGIVVNTGAPQGRLTPLCYFLTRQKKKQTKKNNLSWSLIMQQATPPWCSNGGALCHG